jgi:hypothetical protein
MGQYLQLAQQVQRPVATPDALQPVMSSHGGYDVPMPGARVRWRRGDKSYGFGRVDQVLIDPADTPPIWLCVSTDEGGFIWLSLQAVKLELVQEAPAAAGKVGPEGVGGSNL